MTSLVRIVPGALLMGFGFFCLNYTKAFGVEAHYTWAESSSLPAPSGPIFYLGIAALGLGGVVVGLGVGRKKHEPRAA